MQEKPKIEVTKYKSTRYFAVWMDGELIVVTVYKKGALKVAELLGKGG